jgi:lipoteichoic acid synthase
LLVGLVWAKTMLADIMDFGVFSAATAIQVVTILINPIPLAMFMIGIALFFRSARVFYPVAAIMYILNILLIQLNVIYYREFSDYMSVSVMLGYDKVNQGLGATGLSMANFHDLFFWIDIIIVIVLMIMKKIRLDKNPSGPFAAFATLTFALFGFLVTLTLGEIDRPQLITRQFDSKMMVKYLGMDAYTAIDGIKAHGVSELRKSAKKSDIDNVKAYIKEHYAAVNPEFAGVAKGKNVIVIHLESFQQFLIGMKVNGQEVTPFINSLYNSSDSISFDNFFNQVGQGKTSDAENMLETGTFGLPQGSLFATQGSDQTFQAMPAILKEYAGYSSAVFHGNNASFWNRNNVYKQMGYQYFFDASYYDTSGEKAMAYGLKDKLLFTDSIKYLEHMQEPFYAKYITVSNHVPYALDADDKDANFVTTDSGSDTVDGYFETAHYLDQAVKEFYDYLDKSGLAKDTMVVLYGDHYGISNSENKYLSGVLGKDYADWTDWDNAMLQRVPFIVNMPGYGKGFVDHTYGGEIDVMPTLEHLLGITNTRKFIQVGQDLLSTKRNEVVAFRDKDWTTPTYSYLDDVLYDNATGLAISKPDKKQKAYIKKIQAIVNKQLKMSDAVNQKDLLRFYTPSGFTAVDGSKYNYSNGLAKLQTLEKEKGVASTSLFTKNDDASTTGLYSTDAPQVDDEKTNSSRIQQVNPDGGDSTTGLDATPNP